MNNKNESQISVVQMLDGKVNVSLVSKMGTLILTSSYNKYELAGYISMLEDITGYILVYSVEKLACEDVSEEQFFI